MEVNVEKIMEEIRTEIKEKGYTSNTLSFTDVNGTGTYHGAMDGDYAYTVETANSLCMVPFDGPLTGNPLAVFFKKIIRKLIRFYIRPIVEMQNEFNAQVVHALELNGENALPAPAVSDEVNKKLEKLEKDLEKANKENEELRRRLEKLEEAIAAK